MLPAIPVPVTRRRTLMSFQLLTLHLPYARGRLEGRRLPLQRSLVPRSVQAPPLPSVRSCALRGTKLGGGVGPARGGEHGEYRGQHRHG
jgi:hypothetical protein